MGILFKDPVNRQPELHSDDIESLQVSRLQTMLQKAIDHEDFESAAELRDMIQKFS
jgi:protein-arginine kinase activator protein McsA